MPRRTRTRTINQHLLSNPSCTPQADGQGLGLTFVVQLAEPYDWGWTITESEAGGAQFEFGDVAHVTTEEDEEVHRS